MSCITLIMIWDKTEATIAFLAIIEIESDILSIKVSVIYYSCVVAMGVTTQTFT